MAQAHQEWRFALTHLSFNLKQLRAMETWNSEYVKECSK